MALEVARRLIDGVWQTIVGEDSGASPGGSMPSQWTVGADGSLIIAPDSDLGTFLLSVVAPAGFNLNSPTATMFKIVDENGRNVYEFDAYGDLNLRGSADVGPSGIFLHSVDHPNAHVAIYSGSEDPSQGPLYYRNNDVKSTTPLFRIQGNGTMITGVNAEPADGDLQATECAIWFDPTAASPKLMVKAKDDAGTVVTGEIALT